VATPLVPRVDPLFTRTRIPRTGSPHEVLYFTQHVLYLAEGTRAPGGPTGEGWEVLERAEGPLGGVMGIDAENVQRLKGDCGVLCEEQTGAEEREPGDPREYYERAWEM
jgi:hypothetical protein